ncbi:hypothetical protein [Nostoc sp. CALU 546]|uniref:hypothetical protein n=1 Tax=Nostoc sp. CALU 546 TaxID=1867241 RepID=UPI003B67970E
MVKVMLMFDESVLNSRPDLDGACGTVVEMTRLKTILNQLIKQSLQLLLTEPLTFYLKVRLYLNNDCRLKAITAPVRQQLLPLTTIEITPASCLGLDESNLRAN